MLIHRIILGLLLFCAAYGESMVSVEKASSGSQTAGSMIIIIVPLIMIVCSYLVFRKIKYNKVDEYACAGRELGLGVCTLSLSASWICGAYIYSTAEAIVMDGGGLVWAQAPIGYLVVFILSAYVFCTTLRDKDYMSLFDAFSERFGGGMSVLLFLPTLWGDVMWIVVMVNTLRSCVGMLVGEIWANCHIYVLICCAIACMMCGMKSMAYNNCIILVIILLCIFLITPFIWSNEHVGNLYENRSKWLGTITGNTLGTWIDTTLLLSLGSSVWQVYIQFVLSSKSVDVARDMSISSAILIMVVGILAIVLGICASTIDWSEVIGDGAVDKSLIVSYLWKYILPSSLQPFAVLLMVCACTSSICSCFQATATVFTLNIYKSLFRSSGRDQEFLLAGRVWIGIICFVCILACRLSFDTYQLYILTQDFNYVIIFPQLLLAVFFYSCINIYGSIASFLFGAVLRYAGGVSLLGIAPLFSYSSLLPYRTCVVVCSIVVELLVSWLFKWIIVSLGQSRIDVFHAYVPSVQTKPRSSQSNKVSLRYL